MRTLRSEGGGVVKIAARVYVDGSVETPGIDFGPKGLRIVNCNREFVTFRTFGHSSFSGRGQQSYRPVTFYVVKIERVEVEGSMTVITGDQVAVFDAKADQAQGEAASYALHTHVAPSWLKP